MELGGTCENPLSAKMGHYGYSLMEHLFMNIEALYTPHEIYGRPSFLH